eukprot:Gb_18652 [translate_table: standard]
MPKKMYNGEDGSSDFVLNCMKSLTTVLNAAAVFSQIYGISNLVSEMEAEIEEFELKDEELVDFDGSDYSIGFDDEFGDEEEVGGPSTSTKADNVSLEQAEHDEQFETGIIHPTCSGDYINSAICFSSEKSKVEARNDLLKDQDSSHSYSQEGAESGEIEEDKNEREDGSVSQPVFSFDKNNLGNEGCQGKARKHFRADLEDGELDDSATGPVNARVQNSNPCNLESIPSSQMAGRVLLTVLHPTFLYLLPPLQAQFFSCCCVGESPVTYQAGFYQYYTNLTVEAGKSTHVTSFLTKILVSVQSIERMRKRLCDCQDELLGGLLLPRSLMELLNHSKDYVGLVMETQPEAFNYEAEGNVEVCKVNDGIGHERKKRNFQFVADWQLDVKESERKETQSTTSVLRQNRPRGRQSDHIGSFLKGRPGGRGSNIHISGLTHTNPTPGIMGPTRPLMLSGMRGQIPLHHFGGPLGMSAPIQFQEALAQEQILRSHHAMQLGIAGPLHPPFSMDVPPVHPFVGMDYFGPGPRGMMHLQLHGSNMVPPINFIGSIDNSGRVPRPVFGAGRSLGRGSCANIGGRVGSVSRNGFSRPGAWSSNAVDVHTAGRGRGRGRQMPFSLGANQSKICQESQHRVDQIVGHEMQSIDASKVDELGQSERTEWNSMGGENMAGLNALHDGRNVNNDRERSESEKIQKNALLPGSENYATNSSGSNITKENIDDGKYSISGMPQASASSRREAGSATTNLIQLGGPVQRSRVLTVGGLPKGTPLSTVVEAFEKQGKIMGMLHIMGAADGYVSQREQKRLSGKLEMRFHC